VYSAYQAAEAAKEEKAFAY